MKLIYLEPGVGGVKATLLGSWKALGQIRIVRVKKNDYVVTVGSEQLAGKLLEDSPWNVKGYCFSMTVNNGRKLGNMLGSVIDVEDPAITGNMGYLHLRVDFDIKCPLATFVRLPRSGSSYSKIRL
ncbi:hypothetical protein ACLB2K_068473 [Fragaria x ananassa]